MGSCSGKWSTCEGASPAKGAGWNLCLDCTSYRADAMARGLKKPEPKRKSTATFEVTGGAGCPICTPLVGDRFEADALSSQMSAGAFHNGCQHGIEKVDSRDGTGQYNQDELDAVRLYQVSSSRVNTYLRTGNLGGSSIPSTDIRDLDSAMRTAPKLAQPKTLYRGVEGPMARRIENAGLKGKAFVDKGYMSTTGDPSIANDFKKYAGSGGRVVEVRVPAGTPALEVDKIAADLKCDEFLMPRGSRWSVSFAANKVDMILEMLP